MSPGGRSSSTTTHTTVSGKDPAVEQNASGFTAVNHGRDSLPNGVGDRVESAERPPNGTMYTSDPRTARQSGRAASHSARREPDARSREAPNESQQYSSTHEKEVAMSSPTKRKRSAAGEGQTSSASSRYDLSPPRGSSDSPASLMAPSVHRPQEPERNHVAHSTGVNGVDAHNVRGHGSPWHTHRQMSSGYPADGTTPHIDPSDAHMAEALQRETGAPESQRTWKVGGRHDDDSSEQYATYSTDRASQGLMQPGAKRKRVFTNRVKTGCLTCRRRKKKCDEAHPKCNNCLRGDFECEGYSTATTFQKHTHPKHPVPLQSKEGFAETAEYANSVEGRSPQERRASVPYEGVQQMRPAITEDGGQGPHHVSTSPTSAAVRNGNMYPQHWPRGRSYMDQSRPDLPPLSQAICEPPKPAFTVPQFRESVQSHSTSQHSSSSWHSQPNEYHAYTSSTANMRSLPGVAREGLTMEETQRSLLKSDERQRENMLNGQLFLYNDPVLVDERKRCKNALRQFQDADANTAISDHERNRLLYAIFVPPRNSSLPLLQQHQAPKHDSRWDRTGQVRPGLVIETPFYCQYGYNMQIGEDVYIGANCTIIDACIVSIGAKTWIGQNVQILTAMAAVDLNQRTGSGHGAKWQGSPITIEEDVHIGPGVIINPGVSIRRGAQIGPGTVVAKTVEAYSRVGVL